MSDAVQLEQLFSELCDLETAGQQQRLKTLEGENPALARRLGLLLEAHRRDDGLLDSEFLHRCATMLGEFDAESLVGTRLGSYRLEALLGQGGMGVVYHAIRQHEGVEQSVALKLLALPIFDRAAARHFMNEAAILARLDHPAIARLLDWGRTENGWPYLALELVRGQPINAWCRQHQVSVHDRLALMERVASAMDHAHRNLVVHLDLKPDNVLINGHGQPVVLDFGIAQVIAGEIGGRDTTLPRWLTPDYASPEQIMGKPGQVAADVYALGVMLYELLTGARPFDFSQANPVEALALIEAGPVPPRRRLRSLPRDVDAVCLRALHADPGQRYRSAESFGEDLAAVRENRPVRARPDRIGYRVRKAVERHPLSISASLVASVSILVLLAVLWVQSGDLRSQRDLAESERERAESVTRFLVDSIGAVSPRTLSEAGAGLSELMEVSISRLDRHPPSDPHLRAALLEQIARTRLALGQHDAALEAASQGLQAAPAPVTRARLLGLKAGALRSLARYEEALASADRAVAAAEGLDSEVMIDSRRRRAQVLERMTRHDEAQAYSLETLEMTGEDQPLLRAHVHNDLATVGLARMDMSNVETHAGRALELYRDLYDEPHVDTSEAAWRLAAALLNTGRADQALPLLDEAYELRVALYGEDDHRVGEIHYAYSHAMSGLGRYEDGLRHARAAYDIYVEMLPREDPRLMAATGNLGTAMRNNGRAEAAIAYFQRAINLGEVIHGDPFHPDMGAFHNQLADLHIVRGEYALATEIYERLLPLFIDIAGEPSVPTTFIRHNYARSLRGLGRAEEALAHAKNAVSQAVEIFSPEHFMTAGIQAELGQCLLALGRIDEATAVAEQIDSMIAASDTPIPAAQQIPMDEFIEAFQSTHAN